MKKIMMILVILICLTVTALLGSCSSGRGSEALIRGLVQHNYNGSIDNSKVVVMVGDVRIYPYSAGTFFYRTEPGEYTITAAYTDTAKGISLNYIGHIFLGERELLDLIIPLRDTGTRDAWTLYRQGDYEGAIDEFQSQVSGPSRNDAYNGLGWATWVYERDYDKAKGYLNVAIDNFENLEAYAALAGIELARVNDEGPGAFNRAMQNVCRAINGPGVLATKPGHDDVSEGDMLALKALMIFMLGDTQGTEFILANHADELENDTNQHGKDILTVLENFMGG